MTKRQTVIIISIILLPVLLGLFFTNSTGKSESSLGIGSLTKKIGLVKIFDVIYSSDVYVRQLEDLRKDNTIAGVILRIDSPGGAVAPSQEIYEEVMRFRDFNKPVIVSMGNVAASGGYYIAAAASRIFANAGSITGSIGVIMQFPQYNKLLDKLGIKMTTIKAGEYKDLGNPNRDLTQKEKEMLQALLDNTHSQFISHVSLARKTDIEVIRKIADGRIFTGAQALEIGLVDNLGSYNDAVAYLKQSLNLPEKTKVIEKKRTSDFFDEMLSESLKKIAPFLSTQFVPAGCYFLLEHF